MSRDQSEPQFILVTPLNFLGISMVKQNYITHKRALKFLAVLDSLGHFRFSNKQPLNGNVHFLNPLSVLNGFL